MSTASELRGAMIAAWDDMPPVPEDEVRANLVIVAGAMAEDTGTAVVS